jgi:hypothetical protein
VLVRFENNPPDMLYGSTFPRLNPTGNGMLFEKTIAALAGKKIKLFQ